MKALNIGDAYLDFHPKVPIAAATPADRAFIHRFYDSSPLSPSSRYIAVTEFLVEDKSPAPGDIAVICVFDLETGSEVYKKETAAWDSQVGCHAQWGSTDTELYFNIINDDTPRGVRVNIFTNEEAVLDGCIYMLSDDGKHSLSPCLVRISQVQPGYGVKLLKRSAAYRPDLDGIFITDTQSGACRLLISTEKILESLAEKIPNTLKSHGEFFIFHVKWSPDSQKIMVIMRWTVPGTKHNRSKNFLITMNRDGSAIKLLLTPEQWKGGHHPTWCPDSINIIMNLSKKKTESKILMELDSFLERALRKLRVKYTPKTKKLVFSLINSKTREIQTLSDKHIGSGHPTMSPSQRFIISDAYPNEPVAFGDGTVPIRLIDTESKEETCLLRIKTKPYFTGNDLDMRVDPHPAWSRDSKKLIINACPNGKRQVFIIDISQLEKEIANR